ncbi:MAG TPA: glycosyltransferase [Acidobacteriaceae bacterium]|nr:glycosyltransferase [Acidobacteriaceae bacterium]
MREAIPRVAYLPDTFYEVNGVAHTSRQFEAFALRRGLPFFCLHPGKKGGNIEEKQQGELTTLEIPRGSLVSFRIEKDLTFDPAFFRHKDFLEQRLRAFRPDLIHVTGPSEPGILGAWLASILKVPLVAAWHTNLHEYAAQRAGWFLHMLPRGQQPVVEKKIEDAAMFACARFYKLAKVLFAPNVDLCRLLEKATGRHCALMPRGVDTIAFSPELRDRSATDDAFVLGFCGRLSVEKNVFLLGRIRTELLARGISNFRFLIVGHGKEETWLRQNLPNAEFTGVLRGRDLGRAYANMDLFVFPSHTDTFGNVVLEALASGVPAVVTPDGGPRYIVRDGETGCIATDDQFSATVARIIQNPALHAQMGQAARSYAQSASWDSVFEGVYSAYEEMLGQGVAAVGAAD